MGQHLVSASADRARWGARSGQDNRRVYATPLGKVLVYGTVMPWHSDRGPTDAAPNWTEHHRVVSEQVREWSELRDQHGDAAICAAGDFNMTLGGGYPYGTPEGRRLLEEGLLGAGLPALRGWSTSPDTPRRTSITSACRRHGRGGQPWWLRGREPSRGCASATTVQS